jgi:hypothetical protein
MPGTKAANSYNKQLKRAARSYRNNERHTVVFFCAVPPARGINARPAPDIMWNCE